MPACFSEQGGSQRRGGASSPQITGEANVAYLTKKQLQERFVAELLRRLHETPPGTRTYMRVGDLFNLADVHSIADWRAARRIEEVRGGGDEKKNTSR
jgi:hypothetical protein